MGGFSIEFWSLKEVEGERESFALGFWCEYCYKGSAVVSFVLCCNLEWLMSGMGMQGEQPECKSI